MESYQGSYQNSDADFQRLAQSIGSNIQKILQNVSSMQRMIAQVGTSQDNQQLQNQLRQIQHYTGQLAKDTSSQWKELNNLQGTSGEQKQWRIQKERLQNDFTKALNSFQAAQRTNAQKEKEMIKKARNQNQGLLGPNASGNGANLIDIENGAGPNDLNSQQSKTQMLLEDEHNLQQLQEREAAMRQLESDIIDVNTIFKDLATMVHEQGEIVDSIEANVESTQVRVSEGAEQLRQAEQYKIKARKKKFILSCIGIVVLAFIIGIIIWQSS